MRSAESTSRAQLLTAIIERVAELNHMARLYPKASIVQEFDHLADTVSTDADDMPYDVLGSSVQLGLRRYPVGRQARVVHDWLD